MTNLDRYILLKYNCFLNYCYLALFISIYSLFISNLLRFCEKESVGQSPSGSLYFKLFNPSKESSKCPPMPRLRYNFQTNNNHVTLLLKKKILP